MSLALTPLPADVADDERLLLDGALPPLGFRGVGLGVRGAFSVTRTGEAIGNHQCFGPEKDLP